MKQFDLVDGCIVGGVVALAVTTAIVLSSINDIRELKAELNSVKAQTAQMLHDCAKIEGFVYNYQVFRCKPTGKWTAVELGKFQ